MGHIWENNAQPPQPPALVSSFHSVIGLFVISCLVIVDSFFCDSFHALSVRAQAKTQVGHFVVFLLISFMSLSDPSLAVVGQTTRSWFIQGMKGDQPFPLQQSVSVTAISLYCLLLLCLSALLLLSWLWFYLCPLMRSCSLHDSLSSILSRAILTHVSLSLSLSLSFLLSSLSPLLRLYPFVLGEITNNRQKSVPF
ncbi:MAG: hypothetical protein JOS17DRAFT_509090 [Linnemannia elongata]|nr:MAG: hypothetical protein JOS17DRAFT_509090 [Linnemannia elongata]